MEFAISLKDFIKNVISGLKLFIDGACIMVLEKLFL